MKENYRSLSMEDLSKEIVFQKKLIFFTEKYISDPSMKKQAERLHSELNLLNARMAELENQNKANKNTEKHAESNGEDAQL